MVKIPLIYGFLCLKRWFYVYHEVRAEHAVEASLKAAGERRGAGGFYEDFTNTGKTDIMTLIYNKNRKMRPGSVGRR